MTKHVYLESDGKLLLVYGDGTGPAIPQSGRANLNGETEVIRLPTESELSDFGIIWEEVRTNKFRLGQEYHTVVHGKPLIDWPGEWAWKDSVISDNAVDPVARESVYRTIHRVVSKVMILNSQDQVLLAKVSRGFFLVVGHFQVVSSIMASTRVRAVREAMEELGISIVIDDPKGENGEPHGAGEEAFIQEEIFNEDGINWISFTYKCHGEFEDREIIPKDDEIEEARWFRIPEAIDIAVSIFDIEALKRLI